MERGPCKAGGARGGQARGARGAAGGESGLRCGRSAGCGRRLGGSARGGLSMGRAALSRRWRTRLRRMADSDGSAPKGMAMVGAAAGRGREGVCAGARVACGLLACAAFRGGGGCAEVRRGDSDGGVGSEDGGYGSCDGSGGARQRGERCLAVVAGWAKVRSSGGAGRARPPMAEAGSWMVEGGGSEWNGALVAGGDV